MAAGHEERAWPLPVRAVNFLEMLDKLREVAAN
jgi:hypothetical protein